MGLRTGDKGKDLAEETYGNSVFKILGGGGEKS